MSASGERLKDEGSRLQVVAAGATAGMVARFVIAPLDVVKIRLQLQSHSLSDPLSLRDPRVGPVYKGTIPTMRQIVQAEGLTGLWKGNVPAELLYIAYSAIQFTAYRSTAQLLQRLGGDDDTGRRRRLPPAAESFIAGAAAGVAATAATYPLDLLRTRFAAQGNDRVYSSLRRAVADIWRDEGPRGFFRGLGPAVGQTLPFMGTFFAVYESLRAPLSDVKLPFLWGGQLALASITASAVAKTAVFPLDLVRRRIQVQGPTRSRYVHRNIPEYRRGALHTVSVILRAEGVRGLYRGLTVSLLKAAPASAVTMWTYERVLRTLIQLEQGRQEKAL